MNKALKMIIILTMTLMLSALATAIDVSNCQVIDSSGSYSVINGINGATFDIDPQESGSSFQKACIVINSNSVTLDCEGNNISNLGIANSVAIFINGTSSDLRNNITIKDCTLNDYNGGIYVEYGNLNVYEDLNIYHNIKGIKYDELSNSTIQRSVFTSNSTDGGIDGYNSRNITITQNTFTGKSTGLLKVSAATQIITSHTISYNNFTNAGAGIDVAYGIGYEIINNRFVNITGDYDPDAVWLDNSVLASNVSNNYFNNIEDNAVMIWDDSEYNFVENNEIIDAGWGISIGLFRSSVNNTLRNNTVEGGNYGFQINEDENHAYNNTASNCTIYGMSLTGSKLDVVDNIMHDNVVGFSIATNTDADATMSNNLAHNNTGAGINFTNGVYIIDGGFTSIDNDVGVEMPSGAQVTISGLNASSNTNEGIKLLDTLGGVTLTLVNSDVSNNGHGITGTGLAGFIDVSNSTITNNANYGIRASGPIYLSNLANTKISGNSVGIHLENAATNHPSLGDLEYLNISAGSSIHDNTEYGVYFEGVNVAQTNKIFDTSFYANGKDLYVNVTDTSGATLNLSGVSFQENLEGSGATNISMYTDMSSASEYFIDWLTMPGTLPTGKNSVGNQLIDFDLLSGTLSVSEISWKWQDSDLTSINESSISLWKYEGGWTEVPATLDVANNRITATSFTPASGYGPMGDPLSGGSGSQAGIPEFSMWTLLIGLIVVIGGFLAIRRQE